MAETRPPSPDDEIRNHIDSARSLYEQSVEDPVQQIEKTTFPWVVRIEVRNMLYEGFIDPPAGLGDNWAIQRMYSLLGYRAKSLERTTYQSDAKAALGFNQEPWRSNPIIPRQDKAEYVALLMTPREYGGQGKSETEASRALMVIENQAKERAPILSKELLRSRGELSTVRRLIYQWWAWRNTASGQEVGQDYLDSKIPVVLRYDDIQKVFALPGTFMGPEEVMVERPGSEGVVQRIPCPGYPELNQIDAYRSQEKLTKEKNFTFGEIVQQEVRLMNLVALADQPEEIMKWKLRAETKKLHEILAGRGVNEAYLHLKRKGVDFLDATEEQKIAGILRSLTLEEKADVNNAFWRQFGFADSLSARDMIGYPEYWIPLEARRGETKFGDSTPFFEPDMRNKEEINIVDRETVVREKLTDLATCWADLSPLNNKTPEQRAEIDGKIRDLTNKIRELSTSMVSGGKLVTIIPSLQFEKEYGLRGNQKSAVFEGCVWARSQMAKDRDSVFNGAFMDFVGGNPLAYEEALAIAGLIGFPSKWGYYARDYDPSKHVSGKIGYDPGEWQTDVEAWPYTSEYQNIMAFDRHQAYKGEAAGPPGSRCRLGPLMTDYLSAYSTEKLDENNNKLFIVVDKDGKLKYGRSDEGLIVADTTITLLDYWHEGGDLSKPEPWSQIVEDPFRRFKLRGFFASGKTVFGPGGNELLGSWKKQDWKLDELESTKFWDDYKLARRVALREELFNEPIWREVVRPIDLEYRRKAAGCLSKVVAATDKKAKIAVMKEYRGLYKNWREARIDAIFDYSDEVFWDGVMSSSASASWQKEENANKQAGRYLGSLPSSRLSKIVSIAKSRGIHIFGKVNNKDKRNKLSEIAKVAWDSYFK